MNKQELKPIVRTYYDALEEGNILGRQCTRCGHIEFPPYLCCNECGCLDTRWVNLNNMRGKVNQVLPTLGAFGDPDFRKQHGDYWAVGIEIPHVDTFCSSLLHIDPERLDEFTQKIYEEDVYVKPLIIQDEDVKVVVWELEDGNEFKKMPEIKEESVKADTTDTAVKASSESASVDISNDEIAQTVIKCAAESYGVDAGGLTLTTDIREDLSNESMKMVVMISQIEDELGVTIEIQEASLLNTLLDFTNKVKELKGMPLITAQDHAAGQGSGKESAEAGNKAGADVIDDPVAQSVIRCAAESYGVDAGGLTLATDIREDLSNESMKMVVMISQIEDELGVTIEIQEASLLNTLGDFVEKAKEKM